MAQKRDINTRDFFYPNSKNYEWVKKMEGKLGARSKSLIYNACITHCRITCGDDVGKLLSSVNKDKP